MIFAAAVVRMTRVAGDAATVNSYGEILAYPLSGQEEALTSAQIDLRKMKDAQARSELVRSREGRQTHIHEVMLDGSLH